MQLRNFDLNLLIVFDAVFEEHSIAAASERLSLSQSAVSHALGRLRRALSDDLFVREADGMQPTAKARQIAIPIKSALGRLGNALGGEPFDPARAMRSFSIGASDYATTTIIPRLVESLASAAPSVDIYIVPANRVDMIRQLDEGNIDLAVGWFATVPERFGRTKLLDEDSVFVVRAGHPLASEVPTIERVLDFRHIAVNLLGSNAGLMDGFLPERGRLASSAHGGSGA
jgi:DNA-binding transcriptional LysR family regulator